MALRAMAIAAILGFATVGCGAQATVLMVSGRDDQGVLERPALDLQRSPSDKNMTGTVKDGAFVKVLRRDGAWTYVATVEAIPQEGWIEDRRLRGLAVHLDRKVRVRFLDAMVRDDQAHVLVQPVTGGDSEWVPASALREVSAR